MLRKLWLIMLFVLSLSTVAAQQVMPRIEGLEGNAEYMSLLSRDAQLKMQEDSIVNAVAQIRHDFRNDENNRQKYAQDILTLESRLFALRGEKGRLMDKISSIEQAWVLANLDKPTAVVASSDVADTLPKIDESGVRHLIGSVQVRRALSESDYTTLCRAEALEPIAVSCVTSYINNHKMLAELLLQYNSADNEQTANGIYGKYKTLTGLNGVLNDSLSNTWTYIYDNKTYAYGYLLEKMGRDELLSAKASEMASVARKIAAVSGEYQSDAVVSYFIQKRFLIDYESAVAEVLGLTAARDSLKLVSAQVANVDYKLPKTVLIERSFIDYAPLEFLTSRSSIQPCKIYERGTAYRVMLGSYNTRQSTSIFRGASPLSYIKTDEGKYEYFVGCFAEREQAEQAVTHLKSKGFRRPQIVVWNDGVRSDVEHGDDVATERYRIEIVGVVALSEQMKAILKEEVSEYELTRIGDNTLVVGAFDSVAVANRVAEAMRQADTNVEIKVVAIE